jgi:hypothetical protein
MPTASLIEIMDEMADQIRNAFSAVTDVDIQIEPRLVVNPTPPTIDLYPGDSSRDPESASFVDLNGAYLFTVRARVQTADTVAGQDLLLAFMDDENPLCLAQALDDDPTLNGLASSMDARDPSGYRVYPLPGAEGGLLGFQFTAVVIPGTS